MDGLRKARLRRTSGWILLWASVAPSMAFAQANACHVPAQLDVPGVERPGGEVPHSVAIRSYTLALSWSPEFCRGHPDDDQCDTANGQFGFIIHGLWPEGAGQDHPQWCAPAAPLPAAVVRAQFCAMPSARLIAHEWAKHGVCATSNPADYFGASRRLYGALHIPDMNALSRRPLDVGGFKRVFAAGNPAIAPSALVVANDRNGGWLRELRICLSRDLKPQPCARAQGRGAPDGAPLKIWRGGR